MSESEKILEKNRLEEEAVKTMTFSEYKKSIEDFLLITCGFSKEVTDNLMEEYKDDLQDFLKDGWTPSAAGTGMYTHLA